MIEIKNLSFSYPTRRVFENLTLVLPDAPVLALLGPSGSGKTTFLKLLMGLIQPQRGGVAGISGRRIGAVFQEDRLLPWKTLVENISLPGRDPAAPADMAELLEELGLSGLADAYPAELSGGMQRRAAIARALFYSSDLLLMDEPFKGLDAELKKTVMALCGKRARQIVFITHEPEESVFLEAQTLQFPLQAGADILK